MTLILSRSYRYGTNGSKAAGKIATGEKDCHECSLCVTARIVTAYQ